MAGQRRQPGTPILGPLLLIAAGVVLLLNSLDIVSWAIWGELWKLWPVVLIAIGLDLLFGRRSPLLSLLIVLLVIASGAGLLFATGVLVPPGKILSTQVSEPVAGVTSADLKISTGVNALTIGSLNSEAAQLFAGTLEYYDNRGAPGADTQRSGSTADIKLEQRDSGFWVFNFWNHRSLSWDVRLNQGVPFTLSINTGTGNSELDLRDLRVVRLDLTSGTGNTTMTFPQSAGGVTATVKGGVGNLELNVPAGVEARIKADTGIGNANVDPRFVKSGDLYESAGYSGATNRLDLQINMGVGNVSIRSR